MVIAIIALLIGILVPALAAARKRAWASQCEANLHAFGQALGMYENDSDGYLPFSNSNTAETAGNANLGPDQGGWSSAGWLYWFKQQDPNFTNNSPFVSTAGSGVGGQTGNDTDVELGALWQYINALKTYRCPADADPKSPGPVRYLTSYIMNSSVSGFHTAPANGIYLLPSIKAEMLTCTDIIFWEPYAGADAPLSAWNDGNNEANQDTLSNRHGLSTVACTDGHCESMSKTDFQTEWQKSQGTDGQPNRLNFDPRYACGTPTP